MSARQYDGEDVDFDHVSDAEVAGAVPPRDWCCPDCGQCTCPACGPCRCPAQEDL